MKLSDIPEINPLRERACTGHEYRMAVEGDLVRTGTVVYIDLRCPVCHRPRGLRMVRKSELGITS